jgi:hypothetical protein
MVYGNSYVSLIPVNSMNWMARIIYGNHIVQQSVSVSIESLIDHPLSLTIYSIQVNNALLWG